MKEILSQMILDKANPKILKTPQNMAVHIEEEIMEIVIRIKGAHHRGISRNLGKFVVQE
jgi:hypothetical protein